MSKLLVTVRTDNITRGTQGVDCTGGYRRIRLNGLKPDQNLRNDVVTPKMVFIISIIIKCDDGFV